MNYNSLDPITDLVLALDDESAVDANSDSGDSSWSRREILMKLSAGALGVGLLGKTLPAFAQPAPGQCLQVLRFSKDLSAEIGNFNCQPCSCQFGSQTLKIFQIKFDFKGVLKKAPCDEGKIPNDSILRGTLSWTLRADTCPPSSPTAPPVKRVFGCHDGTFDLIDPSGNKIFSGTLGGTQGFDPRANGAARCCWTDAQGCLKGKGLVEKYKGCTICATYLLTVPFNSTNPCQPPPQQFRAKFDGVSICPC
jgi:hypothetical protein